MLAIDTRIQGPNMPVLLVIDDEPAILHAFQRAFRGEEISVRTASSAAEGLQIVNQARPDVVVLDLNLPDQSGLETFHRIRQIDARIPVIFITGHGTTETAIEAMKLGAYEYLFKPLELDALRDIVSSAFAISRLMHVPVVTAAEEPPPPSSDVLIGRSAQMQKVYKAIGRVAAQDVNVLVLGESGTGKELAARAIYQHSPRAQGPFLTLNCAAIPETLLESELFGHEKGAFTGAERKRIGKFEQCTGGTLFLDEIGDMSPVTQTKILRVLQEQRFERVGGNETVQTDVRLIAATNRDLEQLVAAGQFRTDLYYRLTTYTIKLPPLRERLEDLPLLVDHFLRRFSRELGRRDVQKATDETMEILGQYPWPGNLRELQGVLKQALLQATAPLLLPDFLPDTVKGTARTVGVNRPTTGRSPAQFSDAFISERLQTGTQNLYAESLASMERQLITRVLEHTRGNQLQAAKILGITRGSLRFKIRALGLTIERSVGSEDNLEE
jgi:two-component system nitrogen regulation response regulator GlnG